MKRDRKKKFDKNDFSYGYTPSLLMNPEDLPPVNLNSFSKIENFIYNLFADEPAEVRYDREKKEKELLESTKSNIKIKKIIHK